MSDFNPDWESLVSHPLPVGTRVRHYGEQYIEVEYGGTGVIVEVKGPYGDRSYEYLVQRDKARWPGEGDPPEPSWWASYMTRIPLYLPKTATRGA